MKVRRSFNNKDIDTICDFFRQFNLKNIPRGMNGIKERLNPGFDLQSYYKCYFICETCGEAALVWKDKCQACDGSQKFNFYLCSIQQQLRQLFLAKGFLNKIHCQKQKHIEQFSWTTYGQILKNIPPEAFTLMINADGVCTSNKNMSLWPFVIIMNELPIPERRYIENVLVAGTIPTMNKPKNIVFETCLGLISQQLHDLENGEYFYTSESYQKEFLRFYLIASCTDKPAEALMQNTVQFNAQYGCSKCFHKGD